LFTDLFFSVLGLLFSLQICFSFGFAFFSVLGGRLANGFLLTAVQLLVASSCLLGEERDDVCEREKGRCNTVRVRADREEDSGGCRCVQPEEERSLCGAGLLW
jgi:hypothetical protein